MYFLFPITIVIILFVFSVVCQCYEIAKNNNREDDLYVAYGEDDEISWSGKESDEEILF